MPDSQMLNYGELAVNYNAASPFIALKDSQNNVRKIVTLDKVSLSGLNDLELSELANGDILAWNGDKWVNAGLEAINSVDWGNVQNKPTTLSGYGISSNDELITSLLSNYLSLGGGTQWRLGN